MYFGLYFWVFEVYDIMKVHFLGEKGPMILFEFRIVYVKNLHSKAPRVKEINSSLSKTSNESFSAELTF